MTYYVRPYRNKPSKFEVDIKILLPDGTLFRERKVSPVSTKSASERWAAAREREVLLQGVAPKAPRRREVKTLAAFWPEFIAAHAEANNQKPSGIESKQYHFRQYLRPVLGGLGLDEIDNQRVAELKRYMTSQLGGQPNHKSRGRKSSSTINNCLSTLSKCLKCAVDWRLIPSMPCKIERLRKTSVAPKFYDFDAFERLVAAAAALDERVLLVVLLGGEAGLRRGEILGLEQARADTRTGKLVVERNQVGRHVHETKGLEARTVPMTERLRTALASHRHLRGPRVLYRDDGKPATAATLRGWLREAQKAAGLPRATGEMHILRHTFCSHLAMRGAAVGVIQRLAGHKHLATTIRYMHLAEGEADRAIRLLEQARPTSASDRGGDESRPART